MQLARTADTVRVMTVLPGSAGAKAGLREGDVVTALDGRPLAAMGPGDVAAVLDEGAEGSLHVLDVVRDGKTKRVKLRLKELL
jgi:S1-C subfamily serine protease